MSSKGIIASVGMKLKRKRASGIQLIGVLKSGSDATSSNASLTYTQFGSAMELYFGKRQLQFLLGTLFSLGSADHPSGRSDNIYYVALEPYIGLQSAFTNHFSILGKLGYEWRNYNKASYSADAASYSSQLTAYALSGSLLLQYSF